MGAMMVSHTDASVLRCSSLKSVGMFCGDFSFSFVVVF
jgi:hypothetical protein